MKKRTKIILIVLGALFVVVILINMVGSNSRLTKVQAEGVSVLDLTEEVSASGWIQPETKVNITAEVTAEIVAIPVKEGQTVAKGRLLIQLDTVQYRKDLDQYQFSLDEMRARTEASKSLFLQAEEEFERQRELFKRDLTSERQFKNAEYAYLNNKYSYEAMRNQTKQARARYEKAEDNLSKTRILAPMNGVITYMDAEVGEIAPAQTAFTQGKTLMTISNLSTFEVEVDVDETEIIKIERGQTAKIEVDAFPDTVFAGEIVEIGNTAVIAGARTMEQSTNFKVKVLFKEDNADIKPGMSATVDIITNSKEGILAVPYGAVVMRTLDADSLERAMADTTSNSEAEENPDLSDDDTTIVNDEKKEKKTKEMKGVFVVKEGKAEFVPIETGIADQKNIEITSGLTEKDTVITGPYRILRTIESGEEIEIVEKPKLGKS